MIVNRQYVSCAEERTQESELRVEISVGDTVVVKELKVLEMNGVKGRFQLFPMVSDVSLQPHIYSFVDA